MNDTAQPAQRRRPIWRRPWVWIVVLGLAAAAVAAPFVAEWMLRRTVDATLLQDTINAALAGSTDDLYYIEVGELDYTIADGDVLARNVRLRPRIDAIHERRAAGTLPALLFDVVVDEVSFVGIDLAMLAQERDLYAMRVSLQRPRVRIINAIDLARQAAEDAAARNSDAGQVLPQLGLGQREGEHGNETLLEHLVEGLPVIDIREVRIDNADITSEQLTEAALLAAASSSASVTEGTLDLETVNSSENIPGGGTGDLAGGALIDPIELLLAEAPATESIENISISLEDLRIDTASARDPDKILFSDNVRVEIGRYTRTNADGLYRLETGPVVLSTGDSSIQIDSVAFAPTVSDAELARRRGRRADRIRFSFNRIVATNVDYPRLLERLETSVGKVELTGWEIDVFSDKRLAAARRVRPPWMPQDIAADGSPSLRIDEIELRDGKVTYSEVATDGARPGSITFEDIHGSIVNVTNDPERMSDSSPAVVDIEARFGGSGDVSLEMRLPLLASPATMSYRGSVTNLDASALNSILPNLLGLRFTRGRVDSIAFNIDVARGRATGSCKASTVT